MKRRNILILLVSFLFLQDAFAQIRDKSEFAVPEGFYFKPKNRPIRSFLNKLTFGLSLGYGGTLYRQQLDDYGILQDSESGPVIFSGAVNPGDSVPGGLNYFYNRLNFAGASYNTGEFIATPDTTDLRFRSYGHSIPLSVTIHYDFQNYKIGAGFTLEYHRPGAFEPDQFMEQVGAIQPEFNSAFFQRYYGILGARFFRYYDIIAGFDARIGVMRFSNDFDRSVISKGIFVNVGFPIEKEFSEYFSAYVRPAFDYKNFTLNIPESNNTIPTSMNAFFIEFGVTYRIPELPKCFIKKCSTQVNHLHGEYQYRSRVHPFYKWQNPHHGQNYPELIRYKGKNKKKLNPY